MPSLRLTQLTVTVITAATFVLLVFLTRTWFSLVGVAAVTGLAVFAGFRTVDKLSLFQSDVILTITAGIFPFIRRTVKSYNSDNSVGYELKNELSKLLNCIVRHCVQSWYYHISECQSPVNDSRVLIGNVTKLLVGRLSHIDRYRFLCKVLRLYKQHLSCFGERKQHSLTSSTHAVNIPVSKRVKSSDNEQAEDVSCSDEARHLNAVVFIIVSKLLDEHHPNCLLGKEILVQIIVKEVLLKVLDIASEPEWIYDILTDILQESSCDNSDIVIDGTCTSIPAENDVYFQVSSSSRCFNDVVDQYVCESEATAAEFVYFATESGHTGTIGTSSNDEEQLLELADAASGSCSDERSLITSCSNGLDVNHHGAASLSCVDTGDDVSDHGSKVSCFLQDQKHKERRHLRSNSDSCLTFEQKKLETSVQGSGYEWCQHDNDNGTKTLPELLSDNITLLPNTLSSLWKKRPNFRCILPSFKTQEVNDKVDPQSVSDVVPVPVLQMPVTKGDYVPKTSCSRPRSHVLGHKLMKTKSFCGLVKDADVKPRISHSVSVNALVPESESDASTGLSRHLSHFVRKFSLSSVRIPQPISGSSGLPLPEADSTCGTEFECVSDVKVSVAEAKNSKKDFALHHQPQFLFDSICISKEEEEEVPISKPYTAYVIGVRIIF